MILLDLAYDIRDAMFKTKPRLTNLQQEKCFVIAFLLSLKINDNNETLGIKELLEELHCLRPLDDVFNDFPFNDDEIVKIVDSLYPQGCGSLERENR